MILKSNISIQFSNKYFNGIQKFKILNEILNSLFFYLTPLYQAVENGKIDIINLLLANDKLDINLTSKIFFEKYEETNIDHDDERDGDDDHDFGSSNFNKHSSSDYEIAEYDGYDDYDERKSKLNVQKVTLRYEWKEIAKTPFFLAVEKKNLLVVKRFLENPNLDINFVNIEKSFHGEETSDDRRYIFKKHEEEEDPYEDAKEEEDINVDYEALFEKEIKRIPKEGFDALDDDDDRFRYTRKTALHLATENGTFNLIRTLLESKDIV